jgi:transcriptional regulator with XRE-family HTH domain
MVLVFHHQLLAKVRVELGLTQEDAARTVGVDVRTYRRYESGEVNEGGGFGIQRASRRKILERISRELGIDTSELLLETRPRFELATTLPRARHFVGRAAYLTRLQGWLSDAKSRCRVLAVVAMGGAGKTSLVEQALSGWSPASGTSARAARSPIAGWFACFAA